MTFMQKTQHVRSGKLGNPNVTALIDMGSVIDELNRNAEHLGKVRLQNFWWLPPGKGNAEH